MKIFNSKWRRTYNNKYTTRYKGMKITCWPESSFYGSDSWMCLIESKWGNRSKSYQIASRANPTAGASWIAATQCKWPEDNPPKLTERFKALAMDIIDIVSDTLEL